MRIPSFCRHPRSWFVLALVALILAPLAAFADDKSSKPDQSTPEPGIEWQKGPLTANLGNAAQIQVPAGFVFTSAAGTKRFLELNQNPTSGDELGILMPERKAGEDDSNDWFVLFEFNDVGYVEDKDKDSLNAGAILESIKKGTEEANDIRKQKGWTPFHITGWSQEPFYDARTHNLTWSITGQEDGSKSQTINYSVRILGRKGTMSVDLVLSPEQLATVKPKFEQLLDHFSYTSGNRYSEFVKGDKIAGYGLTALIAGGAAAAAVKTGLFAKLLALLAAMWKFVMIGLVAIGSFIRKQWETIKGIFIKKKQPADSGIDNTDFLSPGDGPGSSNS